MFRALLLRSFGRGRLTWGCGPVQPFLERFNKNFPYSRAQYSSARREETGPKFRYLFYMFVFSTGVLYLVANRLEKKKPKTSFTEKEFEEHEVNKGLKRRQKLVPSSQNDVYRFYVVPYTEPVLDMSKINEDSNNRTVKVIDSQWLISEELKDDSRKYYFLLQDLLEKQRPFPKGLITALFKEEIRNYLNTRNGLFDTDFILTNFPQTVEEAIKFENEVSEIKRCIVNQGSLDQLSSQEETFKTRSLDNVFGYFNLLKKTSKIDTKEQIFSHIKS